MNCTEARDAMLVADLAELRRDDGSDAPLGAHLAVCDPCRSLAQSMVEQTALIGALLAVRQQNIGRPRTARRVALLASLPIAAAVVVTVTMSVRRSDGVVPRVSSHPLPPARTVSIDVARGQRAAVLKTADPSVTVIWLSSGEDK
jgi:hypothetical protein